jgi:uncharacterized protein YdeI (YjbR/CyaY-like superfamily)
VGLGRVHARGAVVLGAHACLDDPPTDDRRRRLSRLGAVDRAERFEVATLRQWRAWLRREHSRDHGVWVVFFKQSSGRATIGYEDLVCEAVCWGWIDSKVGRVDDDRTRIWFCPRRAGSPWSESNRRRVEAMIDEGRMQPSGMRQVDDARASGRWVR